MSVNEPVMSSSPMTLENGSNKKRSISTSLINFFNKIKTSNNNTHTIHNSNDNNDNTNQSYNNDLPQRKKKKLGYPESSTMRNNSNIDDNKFNNNEEPLILYENDDSMEIVRPPILPILPVQRLKLLRQKQMLRLQNDSRLINHTNLLQNQSETIDQQDNNNNSLNYNETPQLSLPTQDYDQSVIIHKSGTPSPVKNSSRINELVLDSNNNIINKRENIPIQNNINNKAIQLRSTRNNTKSNKSNFKGTKWSGNFEYDLSEYDTKPKQLTSQNNINNNNNNNHTLSNKSVMSVTNIIDGSVHSPKIPNSKLNKFAESNQNKKLSKTKLDLLINGSKSTKTIPTTIVPEVEEDAKIPKVDTTSVTKESLKNDKKSNIVLPTMGFDFIKDNETPSKQVSFSFNKKDKAASAKSKPLLFSLKSSTTTNDKPKNSTTAPKLSFSFGTDSKSNVDAKDSDEEPTRKKRAAPAVSIDMTKDASKPTFSFGTTKPTEDTEKKTPSFSFGIKPQAEEQTPAEKPTFSFGGIGSKPKDSTATDETVKKPTFSFGAAATEKKDNEEDEEEPRRKKPAFSFGAAPTASTTKPSTETKSSFSFGLAGAQEKKEEEKKTPSFSFGLAKPAVTEGKKTPSFSFGNGASTTASTEEPAAKKPTLFSFDKKASAEEPTSSAASKPLFSFGAKPAAPAASVVPSAIESKPSFSFGAKPATPVASTVPVTTPSNPLFSFSKPTENVNKEKSTTPSFSFGAASSTVTNGDSKDKPVNPLLSKPSFTFGSGSNKENTPSPSATPVPSFSFNKPSTDNSTTQLNKEANSLGVSLNNPLLSKPSGFGANASNNNASAPKLFSGVPPVATTNPAAPGSTGFSFSRQQTPGQPGSGTTPGAPSFGGMNNNNNANNTTGGFNFGMSSGSNTPGANPLLSNNNNNSNNNGMQPGGSVFSGGNGPNTMFGGANNNQAMGNSNFNFGQPQQQQQQQQMPSFNPSNQVNIQFNQNANANPMDIFGGSNNNSNININNNLTPQPSQFQTRKIARMRGSRR